jgi:5-methylcytosine-specific restriction endonuclease McrA
MSNAWRNGSTRKWRTLRAAVLRRDGHACQRCGVEDAAMTVDHIVPKSMGGSDDMENLQVLCAYCNYSKGNRFFSVGVTPPTLHGQDIPKNASLSHD